MSDRREIAAAILREAEKVVMKDRGNQHGDAEDSFETIAQMWTAYIKGAMVARREGEVHVTAFDVAQLMNLLKVCRSLHGNPTNPDNYVDQSGYSSLAAMIAIKPEAEVAAATIDKARTMNPLFELTEDDLKMDHEPITTKVPEPVIRHKHTNIKSPGTDSLDEFKKRMASLDVPLSGEETK